MTKTFEVRGGTRFPVDMLRYDSCWPASSFDAAQIADKLSGVTRGRAVIVLETANKSAPTVGRWESFGWEAEER